MTDDKIYDMAEVIIQKSNAMRLGLDDAKVLIVFLTKKAIPNLDMRRVSPKVRKPSATVKMFGEQILRDCRKAKFTQDDFDKLLLKLCNAVAMSEVAAEFVRNGW